MAWTDYVQLRGLHDQAFTTISEGLDLYENDDLEAASLRFRDGLKIMDKALSLELSSSERQMAAPLLDKMRQNYDLVLVKLAEIESLRSSAPQPRPPGQSLFSQMSEAARGMLPSFSSNAAPDTATVAPPAVNSSTVPLSLSSSTASSSSKRTSRRPRSGSEPSGPKFSSPSPSPSPSTSSLSSQPTTSSTRPTLRNSTTNAQQPTKRKPEIPASPRSVSSKPAEKSSSVPAIKGVEPAIQKIILNEVVDSAPGVTWSDIVGLEDVKKALYEMVIAPILRPDIFRGIRAPPKGLLLFGPPGNGKTMIAKAMAGEAKATFFNISASSLTAKYVGESEKLVRALFAIARYLQPAVIFIDEIDSLLSERSSSEHEVSRRLKTEFLVQFDGVGSSQEDRITVMGATNRPWDLDEAVLRRMPKRIFVRLPSAEGRARMISHLLGSQRHTLSSSELRKLAEATEGYSASDVTALCRDAALNPIRALGSKITEVNESELPPITFRDFTISLSQIRPAVSAESLKEFEKWNKQMGSVTL